MHINDIFAAGRNIVQAKEQRRKDKRDAQMQALWQLLGPELEALGLSVVDLVYGTTIWKKDGFRFKLNHKMGNDWRFEISADGGVTSTVGIDAILSDRADIVGQIAVALYRANRKYLEAE